jgi:hypothetical protein
MKMNPEIKARWVAALRSGEYKQTTGKLRDGDAFCCLGVLCNLHAMAHPEIAANEFDSDSYLGDTALARKPVLDWAGLSHRLGATDININGHIAALTEHNDNGATFAEIADAIEEQL